MPAYDDNGVGREILDCVVGRRSMGKIEKIEQEVQALSPEELAEFRAWFLEYDWAAWDRQIERDSQTGRLDDLAAKALRDYTAGKTTPL